jgi:hypothetical protein
MIRNKARHGHASTDEQPPYNFQDILDSADDNLKFKARIQVVWRHTSGQPPLFASHDVAAHAIRPQLDEARKYSVLRADAARQAIRAALIQILPIRAHGVEVVHAAIVLQVDEETLAAARRLEEARRELDLDELARRQVKARLEFLKTECLADPGTAKLFALIGSSPRVGGPPDDATLDEIVRAVHIWRPESRWIELAQLLHQFLRDLNHSEQAELLHIMQSAVRTLGRNELADRIASLTPPAKITPQSADGLNDVAGHEGGAHMRTSGSV